MLRLMAALITVICMAIWPFSSSSSAQGSDNRDRRALSDRIEALESKVKKLEAQIRQLENNSAAEVPLEGGPPRQTKPPGIGYGRGEWRRIGGGWTYIDPTAK